MVSAATLATAQSLINQVTSHFTNQAAALQSASQVLRPAIAQVAAQQVTSQAAAASAANAAAAAANAAASAANQRAAQAAAANTAAQQANQAAAAKQAAQAAAANTAAQQANQAAAAKQAAQAAATKAAAEKAAAEAAAKRAAEEAAAKAAALRAAQVATAKAVAEKAIGDAAELQAKQQAIARTAFQQAAQAANQAAAVSNAAQNVTYPIAQKAAVLSASSAEEGEWLGCLQPTSFEWNLPVGKITPVIGSPIYVSAVGEQLSQSQFISQYGIDPEAAYQALRAKAPPAASYSVTYAAAVQAAQQTAATVEEENWLPCLQPTSFEWNLPVGKITPVIGAPIYVSAVGEQLSREQFIAQYQIDPEPAYQTQTAGVSQAELKLVTQTAPTKTQAEQTAISKGVVNLSTVSQSQPYNTALAIVSSITSQMTGAERSAYVEPTIINGQIGMNISYDWGGLLDSAKDTYGNMEDIYVEDEANADAGALGYTVVASDSASSGADDSAKDADKNSKDAADKAALKKKDALSKAKDALLGAVAPVTNTLGLTSEFLATEWDDIDALIKAEQAVTGVKSLLTYANAKDILMTEEAAYESQAAYDANNCSGPLCNLASAATGAVNNAINVTTQPIADALKPLIKGITDVLDSLGINTKAITDTITGLPKAITDAITGTYDKVMVYLKPYTDQIATTQKLLVDMPTNIINAITAQIKPEIDWFKQKYDAAWQKIDDTKTEIEGWYREQIKPVWDKINAMANLSMKDVEAYALQKYEDLKTWVYAEWEKFKESPTGEVLKQLTALYNWVVTEVGKYLKAGTPTPEESAKMFIDTQKAMQPYVDEYIKTFCSNPLIE